MAINKCSLDNMLRAILSAGNSESNMTIPPSVFGDMFNTVSSIALSMMVEVYPFDERVVEMLEPFTVIKKTPNKGGYIYFEDDFRNLLGLAINKKPVDTPDTDPVINTPAGFQAATLKADTYTVPVRIVPQSEWDDLTTSLYAYPTYNNPIACFFGSKRIKVCPYDIPTVEVRYVRQEKIYKYGYILQPDDTYLFDSNSSVESEWTSAAFVPLFKGMMSLYSIYVRDKDLSEWSLLLRKEGIL